MMETIRFSETSDLTRAIRRDIPEDGILQQSHHINGAEMKVEDISFCVHGTSQAHHYVDTGTR
jgi:hypothetical protein